VKYIDAPDLQERMEEIVRVLDMGHVDISRVKCFRSLGSSTKRTIARCHTLGKLMQKAVGVKAHYAIEFLEKFDKMSWEEQDKTIIHELMHIPKAFGGGFRNHDYVCERNVEVMHRQFRDLKFSGWTGRGSFGVSESTGKRRVEIGDGKVDFDGSGSGGFDKGKLPRWM
jgi:predicted metallopeptidase